MAPQNQLTQGSVAQLDRALHYECRGWGFDSLRDHHYYQPTLKHSVMSTTAPSFINLGVFEPADDNSVVLSLAAFVDFVDKNVAVAKNGSTGAVIIDGQETNLRVITFSSWQDTKVEINRQQLEALAAQGHTIQIVWFNNNQ